eukprot:TRINITY_DN5386_c0_g1_i1.p1 TRINITY_DN5386_c0_g1~~TRINITY_DN5386_c0_g1_i1.p1  ORF type:complete len:283 (-),score=59.37 TRINITY_DN5386_c0_g1_i1:56-904(-)
MDFSIAQEVEEAKVKLTAVASSLGREVTVFMRPAAIASKESSSSPDTGFQRFQTFLKGMEDNLKSLVKNNKATQAGNPTDNPPDSFYDLTIADYAHLQSNRKEDVHLKTKKIRDAEADARRSRITKATIRIQFPDSLILEAEFKADDKVAVLIDFIKRAISQPELPFFIYTTPPKNRIKDYRQTLYAAGLVPSALVYFSLEAEEARSVEGIARGPYLKPEVAELRDLHLVSAKGVESVPPTRDQVEPDSSSRGQRPSEADAKGPASAAPKAGGPKIPKWFKR